MSRHSHVKSDLPVLSLWKFSRTHEFAKLLCHLVHSLLRCRALGPSWIEPSKVVVVHWLAFLNAQFLALISINTMVFGSWFWFQPRPTVSWWLSWRIFLAPRANPRWLLAAGDANTVRKLSSRCWITAPTVTCTTEAVGRAMFAKWGWPVLMLEWNKIETLAALLMAGPFLNRGLNELLGIGNSPPGASKKGLLCCCCKPA